MYIKLGPTEIGMIFIPPGDSDFELHKSTDGSDNGFIGLAP